MMSASSRLSIKRHVLRASIAAEDGDAIRVDADAGIGLERIVEDYDIERFRLELLTRIGDAVIRLEREADDARNLRA